MSAIPTAALVIGALLLTLGLRSSSRGANRRSQSGQPSDSGSSSYSNDDADCSSDGGGCD